jgi:UDP-N-acetylmuramoylalanine-D-glutamate ligase
VLQALPASGCAVFGLDDSYTDHWMAQNKAQQLLGFAAAAVAEHDGVYGEQALWQDGGWSVRARWRQGAASGVLHYRLDIAGTHNVRNSWAAAACALAAGVSPAAIERGLQAFVPVKGRSRALSLVWGGRRISGGSRSRCAAARTGLNRRAHRTHQCTDHQHTTHQRINPERINPERTIHEHTLHEHSNHATRPRHRRHLLQGA